MSLHPELSEDERESLARRRTAELEQRTPHIVTWQGLFWPAHCGDYCRYIKEVGQLELTRLAPDGDGTAFFASHSPDVDSLVHAREVRDTIRPEALESGTAAYSVGVYLFPCLECGEYVVRWDCD